VLQQGAELVLRQGAPALGPGVRPYGDKGRPSVSIIRAPIRQRGQATGLIGVHSYSPQAYSKSDLSILQTLADYCSGAFERILTEERMRTLHRQLLETSRQAGMAEVAVSILHNVGNVLNSVNISTSLIAEKVRKSKIANLSKAMAMMQEHKDNLDAFFKDDVKGRTLPSYLASLSERLLAERTQVLQEIDSLVHDIDHIKEIVLMQQNYARIAGVVEPVDVADLVEAAIHLNADEIDRNHIHIEREHTGTVPATVDKHKVLQILVNLIRNARFAMAAKPDENKKLTIQIAAVNGDRVRISIIDNGIGIPAENLARIFEHGFTTRKDGHGFGLHSSALSARDLGGSLTAESAGPGKGAVFTLEFPNQPPAPAKK
jgi:signal transduction histidine kinase